MLPDCLRQSGKCPNVGICNNPYTVLHSGSSPWFCAILHMVMNLFVQLSLSAFALDLFGLGLYTFPLGAAGAMSFHDPLERTETRKWQPEWRTPFNYSGVFPCCEHHS